MSNNIVSFLRESKVGDYTNIMSDDDVLSILLSNSSVRNSVREKATNRLKEFMEKNESSTNKADNVLFAISDALQSLTKEAISTSEMLEILYTNYSDEVVNHVSNFIKIIYAENFKINKGKTETIDFNKTNFSIKKIQPKPNGKKFIHASEYGLMKTGTAPAEGSIYNMEEICLAKIGATNTEKQTTLVNKTEGDKVISSKESPGLSFVMVDSPDLRIGTRNSLELSTFFNTLSTIELSKCQPYFNATFILPNIVKNESGTIYKTASITQFLEGTPNSPNINTDVHRAIEASFNRKIKTKADIPLNVESVNTNISAFTLPQTVNNFNEYFVGHNESIKLHTGLKNTRATSVHDITRPFMTIKSFNVDVAPTQGLLSFKSGKLSLVLHDRTRMIDIAPFVKPDMFGSFGAEIAVEYGWSHTDSMSEDGTQIGKNNNYLAEFLNSSRVVEKYIITNSSFNMEANGQVNIDLSIAMRGPIDIRSVLLKSDPPIEIAKSEAQKARNVFDDRLTEIRGKTGISISTSIMEKIASEINATGDSKTTKKSDIQNTNLFIKLTPAIIKNIKSADTYEKIQLALNGYSVIKDRPFILYKGGDEVQSSGSSASSQVSTELTTDGQNAFAYFKKKLASTLDSFKRSISSNVVAKINQSNKKTKELLQKIVGGLNEFDPFYNKEWLKLYSEIIEGEQNVDTNGVSKAGIGGSSGTSFVSFGAFLTGLIGTHLTNTGKFDEIQIVSYTANEYCGLMSNLNVASFLIPRSELSEFLKKIFAAGVSLTIESVITQVIERFISTRMQICYGLRSLYKRDESGNTIARSKKASKQKLNVDNLLKKIYIGLAKGDKSKEEEFTDVRFVMPKIKFTFDTITSKKSNYERTISRISIFDQNDNPFGSINTLMKDIYDNKSLTVSAQLNKLRAEYKAKGGSQQKAKEAFYQKSYRLIQSLIDQKLLVPIGGTNGLYTLKSGFQFDALKNNFKNIMPSITYGSQNSAIIDASVSTVNEAKLNTIYLTRSDRAADGSKSEKQQAVKVSFEKDLPLRVLPTQAQVTIFGCPFVNFAQYIFLDFETGTTIDNSYAITGIKHDISPGKFTTQLTLSYGDVYGKYKNAADTIAREINMLQEETKIIDLNQEDDKKISIIKNITPSVPFEIKEAASVKEYEYVIVLDQKDNSELKINKGFLNFYFNIKYYYWKDTILTLTQKNNSEYSSTYDMNILLDSTKKGKKIKIEVDLFEKDKKKILSSNFDNFVKKINLNLFDKENNKIGGLLGIEPQNAELLLFLNSNLVKKDIIEEIIKNHTAIFFKHEFDYNDQIDDGKNAEFVFDINYKDRNKLKDLFNSNKLNNNEILKKAKFNIENNNIGARFKGKNNIYSIRRNNNLLKNQYDYFIEKYEFNNLGLHLELVIEEKKKGKKVTKVYTAPYEKLIKAYFEICNIKLPIIKEEQ